ncbi:hypothetical protein VR45_13085, partial [Streptomyces sp. NRRL S-495]
LPRHRADIAAAAGGCGTGAAGGAGGGCGTAAVAGEGADAAVGGCGTGGGCGPCGGHGHAVPTATAGETAEPTTEQAAGTAADEVRTDLVRVRRRGAGTELAPNA